MSQWGPSLPGLPIGPGKAKTSRPCSSAQRAVTNEPLRCAASTTSTPLLRPLIMRFRRGKLRGKGSISKGNSDTRAPPASIKLSARRTCRRGYIVSKPFPSTAILAPCVFIAAVCATPSIPLASPLVIVTPHAESFSQNNRAHRSPYQEYCRLPTTAT